MNYYIITGASKGIGEAITRALLVKGNILFAVSRTLNEDLVETAASLDVPLFYMEADLIDAGSAAGFIEYAFAKIDSSKAESISLINNAGMIEPIARLDQATEEAMEIHYRLNLLAPAILCSCFIKASKKIDIPKVILNISSGAAHYPYKGWSMYCSSKAGLDMLTRTVGLEQKDEQSPVKIFSLAPGIVDTSMQSVIRESDPTQFEEKDKFVSLHVEGKLSQASSVASVIAQTIHDQRIENGSLQTIDDLRKLL